MHIPCPRLLGVSHLLIYWAHGPLGPGLEQQASSCTRGPGYAFQDPFSSFQGSDFLLRGFNIPFLGYGFSFQVPTSSIQAPIPTLTSELLQYLTLVWFDFWWFLKDPFLMFFKVFNRQREPPKYILLYVNSFDFNLIWLTCAYTKPATLASHIY